MPYIVNAYDNTTPTDAQDAEQGAEELRALKTALLAGAHSEVIVPTFSAAGAVFTYATQLGRYRMMGKRCFVNINLSSLTRAGGAASVIDIVAPGLPVPVAGIDWVVSVGFSALAGAVIPSALVKAAGAGFLLYNAAGGALLTGAVVNAAAVTSIDIGGSYEIP